MKAAEHSRSPKPGRFTNVHETPPGFGLRLCSAALDFCPAAADMDLSGYFTPVIVGCTQALSSALAASGNFKSSKSERAFAS